MHELWLRKTSRPANFQDNYYIYVPNLPAAIVALVLWVAVLVAIVYRSWRYKIWYLTILIVGLLSQCAISSMLMVVESIGYIMRVYGHSHLTAYNPYVTMQALVILAPVMFAAANYVIFGRLLHYGHLIYPGKRLTWLPTRHVVAVFVTSDVISFLVQMGGAILLLNKTGDPQRQQTGQNTLMAGLAINLGSFCFFFTLIIWYEVATRRIARGLSNTSSNGLHDTYSGHPSPGRSNNFLSRLSAHRTYAPIVWATMVSQIFLIWRSIYRVIEFQQGYFSPIATTEIYFYFFDTLIMLLATAIYVFLFPPAFGLLGKRRLVLKLEEESVEMGRRERGEGEVGVKGGEVG